MNFREWQSELQEWHAPDDFQAKLRDARAEHGSQLITAPGAQFFRDAYPACQFAILRGAQRVRLVAGDRPDFEEDGPEGVQGYEVTEADMPGRKRGDEMRASRELAAGEMHVAHVAEDTWLTPEVAVQILHASAERKSKGGYNPEWGLLILLNPWNFGADQRAIEECMVEATAIARDSFAAVWVLWQGVARNTWLHGAPGSRVLRPAGGAHP